MQKTNIPNQYKEDAISLLDIVKFIKESYKKVALFALGGLICAFIFTFALGQYTASITLLNYAELDVARIKYLQAALPKLSQDKGLYRSQNFLDSEQFWKSAVKVNTLIGKSDVKDLLEPSSLKSNQFNIYALDISSKASNKLLAEERIQESINFLHKGMVYIDLRNLIRKYQIDIVNTISKLGTDILKAEVELAYIERRIKSLNELKRQYPAAIVGQNNLLQLVDAKDAGAKYLPVLSQIIAATTDQNDQIELLQRHREGVDQMRIYSLFVEKAKPLLDADLNDPNLLKKLLDIIDELKKGSNTNYAKIILSTIESDLNKIKALKLYGLPQIGSIKITKPDYLINTAIGLFGGAMVGILLAFGLYLYRSTSALK